MPLVRAVIAALMLGVLSAAGAAVAAEPIRISAAISLKDALEEAGRAYKAAGAGEVEFVFGSSGELMAQIKAGAPADAFISAAEKQVDDLARAGKVNEATRRVVAGNRLVLIVPARAAHRKSRPGGFKDLADPAVGRVAIGEPRTVPAGQYAMQVLTALRLADGLGDRLVYGSNVRQVLDYVERGEAAAGVVYATDARQAGDKVKVVATADESTHDPIVYPAVIVRASRHKAEAQRFLDFLGGANGKAILAGYGFTDGTPKVPTTRPDAVSDAGK